MHRNHSKSTSQNHNNTLIKKCSLKNLHIYDPANEKARGRISSCTRDPINVKRHILDRILSRF